jgi:hypothetical protein
MGTSLDIADGEDRQELVAEVRVVDNAAEAPVSSRVWPLSTWRLPGKANPEEPR